MPVDWPLVPLGTVAENLDARRIPLSSREREKRRGRYPYYGAAGVIDHVDEPIFSGLHLLVGEDGSVVNEDGSPVLQLADGEFWVNNHAHVIRAKNDIDTRFLSYALRTVDVRPFITGAVQPKLTQANLSALRVPFPPQQIRQNIVTVLGTLDNKIELNHRINETLEALTRAIFKSWFVEFDPVRAKMAGRRPVGMSAETAALFPDRLQKSQIREIPSGWRIGSILDIAQLLSGGTPKTHRDEYWNGGIPWASAKDVSQARQTFLVTTERTITPMGLAESATQMIPAFSTVVVSRGATTGRMVMLGKTMAMNQTCYALVSSASAPFALYSQMQFEMDALVQAAHGSVFDTITTDTFSSSKVLLPDRRLLVAFDNICRPMFLQRLSMISEARTLANLRDTLLPKLILGDSALERGRLHKSLVQDDRV